MNTPSLQHVGNVLEPFSRLQVCFLALATCIARLMGVGNVHGAFPGVGNLNGAAHGRWQLGWHQDLVPSQATIPGVVAKHSFSLARWQRARAFLKAPYLLLGCVALATPILSWQRQLLFFQDQA
ncbi:uncharacterized protein DS421_10g301120 [Arachis hypogaea]|nr:uncharacterized protein DS421_10g301120 [Arachis hypogaea]